MSICVGPPLPQHFSSLADRREGSGPKHWPLRGKRGGGLGLHNDRCLWLFPKPRASATLSGTPGAAVEFFSTLSGNTYKAATRVRKSKSKKSERYFAGNLNEDVLPPYLEQVYLSQWFFTDLRRQ